MNFKLIPLKGKEEIPMNQTSLSEIVTGAWEEIKGFVLKILKEMVEAMLLEEQDKVLGRGRYERKGSKAWRWGYRERKNFMTPWGTLKGLKIPRIREKGKEVSWLRKNERRVKEIGEWIFSSVVGGMNLRRASSNLYTLLKDSISFTSISTIIKRAQAEIKERKERAIKKDQYKALVLDGVEIKFRKGFKRRKGVLLIAVGVFEDGDFEVVDWEVRRREDFEGYYILLNRVYERGLEGVELVVGDGFSGIFSAVDFVYPFAKRQLCLVHLAKNLEKYLRDRSFHNRRKFRREFWWIYEALTKEEVMRFYEAFKERWKEKEPGVVFTFEKYFPLTINYYSFPQEWRHRVRTTNLAENFFRNLWRFMSRFPGFKDEPHSSNVLGIYLLGVERYKKAKEVLPYAL